MLDHRHIDTLKGSWETAIADLEYFFINGKDYFIGASEVIGDGVGVYSVASENQPVERIYSRRYPSDFTYQGTPEATFLQFSTGDNIHLSHIGNAENLGLTLRDQGKLGDFVPIFSLGDIGTELSSLGQILTESGSLIYAAHQDSLAVTVYRTTDTSELDRVSSYDLAAVVPGRFADGTLDQVIDALADGNLFLVGVSARGDFISTVQLDENGAIAGSKLHFGYMGTGYATPNDLRAVEVAGKSFIIVASPGTSSLTVFQLTPDGGLIPTDHVIDEGSTNFQQISAFDTVSYQGRPYIFAGGIDDGITVFTLQPDGVLLHLKSIPDDFDMALSDLADIEAAVIGSGITLIASSTAESGLTQISFEPGTIGMTGAMPGRTIKGGKYNDMLLSQKGNEIILGNDGDDILIARHPGLQLLGGPGKDIFVPSNLDGRIVIRDFEPGHDQLDLSQLGMVRSLYQIKFHELGDRIRLIFHDMRLEIFTRNGDPLTELDFSNTIFPITHYNPPNLTTGPPPDPKLSDTGDYLIGTAAAEVLGGGIGPDIISAGAGNDTVNGSDGNDTIFGRLGSDHLEGEGGDDLLIGNFGRDILIGGVGNDQLHGMGGHDKLIGGNGEDSLLGGAMNDTLFGSFGPDTILAGPGDDFASGDDGDDLIHGGAGQDLLHGGQGDDMIEGYLEQDSILGGPGDDTIYGGWGDDSLQGEEGSDKLRGEGGGDRLIGQQGRDSMQGGGGDDTLMGNAGDDWLAGNKGNDTLFGDVGADQAYGGNGTDVLLGGSGTDRLFGGPGEDTLTGGIAADRLTGGPDADVFVFISSEDSPDDAPDIITDFQPGLDQIDLSILELKFVGKNAFGGENQLRLEDHEENTYVLADLDGDNAADLAIILNGKLTLTADDFLL